MLCIPQALVMWFLRTRSSPLSFLKFCLFIYFWLLWVTVGALSQVAVIGGFSLVGCTGFSLQWLLLLWSRGSRHADSVVLAQA